MLAALTIVGHVLREGGTFVAKIFRGGMPVFTNAWMHECNSFCQNRHFITYLSPMSTVASCTGTDGPADAAPHTVQ